jgi:protein-tyrosine phosphatase
VIDLHAHILPGLDDGPRDLDGVAALAARAVEGGTRVMAATSHINEDFGLQPVQLREARMQVQEHLRAAGIGLQIVQGGEIAASRVPGFSADELTDLSLGGSGWVLLECPLSPSAPPLDPFVAALHGRGFRVLLAHPERSPVYLRSPEPLMRLTAQGALAQVTAGSFTGAFGGTVTRAAFTMLERGLVHVIASDTHDAHHRPPTMDGALDAFENRYRDGREQFDWLVQTAPTAVLSASPLPPRPPAPRARRGPLRGFRAARWRSRS